MEPTKIHISPRDPRAGAVLAHEHEITLAAELADIAYQHKHARAEAERTRLRRNALIQHALKAGWTHAQIAETTGLTRGRIGQIAMSPVQR
jgi:hypothetical protein